MSKYQKTKTSVAAAKSFADIASQWHCNWARWLACLVSTTGLVALIPIKPETFAFNPKP